MGSRSSAGRRRGTGGPPRSAAAAQRRRLPPTGQRRPTSMSTKVPPCSSACAVQQPGPCGSGMGSGAGLACAPVLAAGPPGRRPLPAGQPAHLVVRIRAVVVVAGIHDRDLDGIAVLWVAHAAGVERTRREHAWWPWRQRVGFERHSCSRLSGSMRTHSPNLLSLPLAVPLLRHQMRRGSVRAGGHKCRATAAGDSRRQAGTRPQSAPPCPAHRAVLGVGGREEGCDVVLLHPLLGLLVVKRRKPALRRSGEQAWRRLRRGGVMRAGGRLPSRHAVPPSCTSARALAPTWYLQPEYTCVVRKQREKKPSARRARPSLPAHLPPTAPPHLAPQPRRTSHSVWSAVSSQQQGG